MDFVNCVAQQSVARLQFVSIPAVDLYPTVPPSHSVPFALLHSVAASICEIKKNPDFFFIDPFNRIFTLLENVTSDIRIYYNFSRSIGFSSIFMQRQYDSHDTDAQHLV